MSRTTDLRRAKSNWENLFCNKINARTHMNAHTVSTDCSDDCVLARQMPNGQIYALNGNGRGTRCVFMDRIPKEGKKKTKMEKEILESIRF